jgi:phosphohistidine phosphatase
MSIYLVQHGLSLPKEIDPEKGLSEKGITDVERIADVAQGYRVQVATIVHSGKKRARQTAEILASRLEPPEGVAAVPGLRPMDDVVAFSARIESDSNTMYVGHLPFMERLAAFLLTGNYDKPVFKFQNGGIVCLYQDVDLQTWVIKWALMPKIE